MILLDTNVVSELRRRARPANPQVAAWFADQPEQSAFVSAATILELERGVLLLRRRDQAAGDRLRRWLEDTILERFAGRILPMDQAVALACAPLFLKRIVPVLDAVIAATALVHDLPLATRNSRDFAGTGVRLVDPWTYGAPVIDPAAQP